MAPNNRGTQARHSVEVAEIDYESNFVREGSLPIWEQTGQAELKPLIASVRADSLGANRTVDAR